MKKGENLRIKKNVLIKSAIIIYYTDLKPNISSNLIISLHIFKWVFIYHNQKLQRKSTLIKKVLLNSYQAKCKVIPFIIEDGERIWKMLSSIS